MPEDLGAELDQFLQPYSCGTKRQGREDSSQLSHGHLRIGLGVESLRLTRTLKY